MGEKAFNTGRMPWTSLDVSADRNSEGYWASPCAVATPTHRRDLIAQLHRGRPEIISELNLDDRLVSCNRHSTGYASNTRLRKGRITDAITKRVRKPTSDAKDPALRIGDILPPHHNPGIALHLFTQPVIDRVNKSDGLLGNISERTVGSAPA